ncbi:MAG: outer membrane protein transport protein, partial [Gammaproteobacteria bacterium]|nr:outer membrane protein transport protein [Gammaproteobacteria bacterium]
IATGMGGASMAYDNGVAAVMNNPATLGLMEDGEARLDVALGNLGPDITSSMTGMPDAPSAADSFFMPAVGYATRSGQLTFGVGMFAQGGMGTEYDANSFMAAGTGEEVRSEVGVGRLVAPIVYNVNKNLTVGGSIDYVFGGMDLKMAMSGTQFADFIAPLGGTQTAGTASGTLVDGLIAAIGTGLNDGTGTGDGFGTGPINTVRFDFSDDSDYTGDAQGAGVTGKIGFTFKVNNNLTIGGTYHAKTAMDDLETTGATVTMNANQDFLGTGTYTATDIPVAGTLSVNDFQFPAQIGLGMAYQQDKWMVAADIKVIQWADVMDSFRMTFTADATQTGFAAGFASAAFDVEMYQNWEDQTVLQVGGAYKVSPDTTLRAGINSSTNPVPDDYLNALFPATIENHLTLGVGYAVSKMSGIDFSLTVAPVVSVDAASGVTTEHSQSSWQLMYSQKF